MRVCRLAGYGGQWAHSGAVLAPRLIHTAPFYATRTRIRPVSEQAGSSLPAQIGTSRSHRVLRQLSTGANRSTLEQAGLNPELARWIASSFPHITSPSDGQRQLWKAVAKPYDVLMRSQTGSGKSFGSLIAVMNRIYPHITKVLHTEGQTSNTRLPMVCILVPTQALAMQYEHWVKHLLPSEYRGRSGIVGRAETGQETGKRETCAPLILITTANYCASLLGEGRLNVFLNIKGMQTLLVDEADAMLKLPGRFASKRELQKRVVHPSRLQKIMEVIMAERQSLSTSVGQARPSEQGGQRREQNGALQLIVLGATVNSVLRNHLGYRAGWLNTKDVSLPSLYIDETAANEEIDASDAATPDRELRIPSGLSHHCLLVDEPKQVKGIHRVHSLVTDFFALSNSTFADITNAYGEQAGRTSSPPNVKIVTARPPAGLGGGDGAAASASRSMDLPTMACLAHLFASLDVRRGLAVFSEQASMIQVVAFLRSLDVPAVEVSDANWENEALSEETLFVCKWSSARGLDIPGGVSHVFNVGFEAVNDNATYVHNAGRAARLGSHAGGLTSARPSGTVITLLRGADAEAIHRTQEEERNGRRQEKDIGRQVLHLPEELGLDDMPSKELQSSRTRKHATSSSRFFSNHEAKLVSMLQSLGIGITPLVLNQH